MDLHVPIVYQGNKFVEFELKKLKAGVIADATEEMKKKGSFAGMQILVSETLKALMTEDGDLVERDFENIIRNSPVQAVEIMALRALTAGRDTGIEQLSICPRCKKQVIYDGEDALHFEDLVMQDLEADQKIDVELDDPIVIMNKRTQEELFRIENVSFRYPLLKDAIKGSSQIPDSKGTRQMYAIYAQAITHVNGEEAEAKFRNSWGMYTLERMGIEDLEKLSEKMKSCGIKKTVRRTCMSCEKQWDDPIDISGFFEEGLQL